MALRHAVLAALLEGEASGYELSKRFDVTVANFWSATPQQLYRELERMAADGMVRARLVEQRRRPNKRVFSLTDAGRQELHDFTAQPARPSAWRDDLAVKLQVIDVGDFDAVREAVGARLEHARAKLELYGRLHADLLGGRSEAEFLARAERVGPYLTLLGGRMYEQLNIRWCEEVLAILAQRAQGERGADRPGPASSVSSPVS